ncbi:tRNA (N6-threonylcarbamoyladenosine(37)-N6)-methyltransferase TrmO [Dactylosporangium sp. CA-139066]|uniref:tRNA (N6-threonylcarbamoyladenosine(37)-N6)-methyltransferase TrmO n=1 Tax=Dactylosporangium sp. CA-139066 TaxID=3239930 RepID=UPI003D93812B
MEHDGFVVRPVGRVESPLTDRAGAPRQGDEGAPPAWIVFEERVVPALADLHEGDQILLLTWLHQADRDVLAVHPRGDVTRPETGVFATRAPDRPNPIGLHRAEIVEVDGRRVLVDGLEAVHGTPILDVKPVIGAVDER